MEQNNVLIVHAPVEARLASIKIRHPSWMPTASSAVAIIMGIIDVEATLRAILATTPKEPQYVGLDFTGHIFVKNSSPNGSDLGFR